MDQPLGVFAALLACAIPCCVSQIETIDQYCAHAFRGISVRECCDVPHLLPDHVVELCRERPLPPAPPGVPEPYAYNCQAECALNVTRVLMDHRFRVKQARKVLLARTANDTAWARTIGIAIDKCYLLQVANSFYLQDVAQNRISSQCIPSSARFLECTFAIAYRDRPKEHWNYVDDRCISLVAALNNCSFIYRGIFDI